MSDPAMIPNMSLLQGKFSVNFALPGPHIPVPYLQAAHGGETQFFWLKSTALTPLTMGLDPLQGSAGRGNELIEAEGGDYETDCRLMAPTKHNQPVSHPPLWHQ